MNETGSDTEQDKAHWAEIFAGEYSIYTFVLSLGMLLFAINQFVVTTIMPSVVADLGGVNFYTWAFSLFSVGAIVGAASAGPLRDAIGVRKAYAGAGLLLALGLVGAALAPDMPTLVAWRLLQGIASGAIASHAYGLVAKIFPERLRGRVLGTISTIWGVATVGGPGFGALFSTPELWRGAFWSLAPLSVLFAYLAWRFISAGGGHGQLSQIPFWRLSLLATAVFLMSATSLTSEIVFQGLLLMAAIGLVAIAFVRDAAADRNIFPRSVTAIHTELGATYWIFFLVSIVLAFVNTYTTFYLQALHGVAPFAAGYLFAVQSLMWTVSAIYVATLTTAYAVASIVAGLVVLLAASIGIAIWVDAGPVLALAIAIGASGVGIGLLNNPAIQHIISIAPEKEQPLAGVSVQAIRNIGIAMGAAMSGTIAVSAGLVDGADRTTIAFAMRWVFGINVAFAVFALAIAIRVLALKNGEAAKHD